MLSFYLSLVETEEERDLITRIYNEYRKELYCVAYSILGNEHDTEDAVSETFMRIISNPEKISDGVCKKTQVFLVIIVRGISINMLNKSKNDANMLSYIDDERTDEPAELISVEDEIISAISCENVEKLLEQLSPALRDTAMLCIINQIKPTEAAELLDIDVNALHQRLLRIRKKLSELLRQENYND